MTPDRIADLIRAGLPGAAVRVESDDNTHFASQIVAAEFAGMRPIARHQLDLPGARASSWAREIHALSIEALTPGGMLEGRLNALNYALRRRVIRGQAADQRWYSPRRRGAHFGREERDVADPGRRAARRWAGDHPQRSAPAGRHHHDRVVRAHGRLGHHRREDAHRDRSDRPPANVSRRTSW